LAERERAWWIALAILLGSGALLGWPLPHEAIDWQPSLATREPWRAFSAVFVHYSALHLAANLAGGALVAGLGHAARLPRRCALAWLAAWPLTQAGLLVQPALRHYGGLSGVLHAGVAIVGVHLLGAGAPPQRRIGAAILLVLVAKVLIEAPWAGPLRHAPGWDIAIAPMAHASGLVTGVLCAAIAEVTARCAYHRRP
jgi:rhomboid family GlyGly-CTERM serine protease